MKFEPIFTLGNIGSLRHAKVQLSDLTIICGENNLGKTYATYAIYGFLDFVQGINFANDSEEHVNELKEKGNVVINIQEYIEKNAFNIVESLCKFYSDRFLADVFLSSYDNFGESSFKIEFDMEQIKIPDEETVYEDSKIKIEKNSDNLNIILLSAEEADDDFVFDSLDYRIGRFLSRMILSNYFPNSFIASAERTGVSIFVSDIDTGNEGFIRNMKKLSELLSKANEKLEKAKDDSISKEILSSLQDIQERILFDYPNNRLNHTLPVQKNIRYIRDIKAQIKRDSFIVKEHSDILNFFDGIAGGKYILTEAGQLAFWPEGEDIKLSMSESASSVRALMMLNFYLRHSAKKGDLLIIDEPELNLHPKNQRKMARLITRLVSAGIKVFITTHSDYIIREINNLIVLNSGRDNFDRGLEENGSIIAKEDYINEELISPDKIKAYIAVPQDSGSKDVENLEEVKIDGEKGINMESFDDVIRSMNGVYRYATWGE